MKQPQGNGEQETFRAYLRRVMTEENLTNRRIEELTSGMPQTISKSWVDMMLAKAQKDTGVKTVDSLAKALNRSRNEVIAAFLEEPLEPQIRLLANIEAVYKKLGEEDRKYYDRVLEDVARSMRRAAR